MTHERMDQSTTAVIVGAGFAGIGCAKALAKDGVHVVLLDRNNYHQFQPLLYQVATAMLAPSDVGAPLRTLFRGVENVRVVQGDVTSVDPAGLSVTTADGQTYAGDYLVLAGGAQPAFFRTPGAAEHAFPLYSLQDAERLRSRVFELYDEVDRDPALLDKGALDFVVVGAGPTGVETAGALADLVHQVLPRQYPDLPVQATRIYLVDHGHSVLPAFSAPAHEYAAKVLARNGVLLRLGQSVREVAPGHVVLGDGTEIPTRCTIWAGGEKAASLARASGLGLGRGGRVDVLPDLSVEGHPRLFVLGDLANIADQDGTDLPQLGSVALQSGQWTAASIRADLAGRPRTPFRYHDKGIMAMISRGSAVAEVGARRHELHGPIAFASWLGVHAWLMSGVRTRIDAFVSWGWDYFSQNRAPGLLDQPDAARIDWRDEDISDADTPDPSVPEQQGARGAAGSSAPVIPGG